MKENWKSMSEFPNYYVSNKGRIKSVDHITIDKNGKVLHQKGKILKQFSRSSQYKFVNIKNINGHFICRDVHRLVAQTFIPNLDNKPQVNHIDGNRTNNNVSNLEWVSAKENMQHAFTTGLINKEKQIQSHLYNARPVIMKKNGHVIKRFRSFKETAREMKTNPQSIKYACIYSKTHIHKGFEFYLGGK